jgi:hypothetical protein
MIVPFKVLHTTVLHYVESVKQQQQQQLQQHQLQRQYQQTSVHRNLVLMVESLILTLVYVNVFQVIRVYCVKQFFAMSLIH